MAADSGGGTVPQDSPDPQARELVGGSSQILVRVPGHWHGRSQRRGRLSRDSGAAAVIDELGLGRYHVSCQSLRRCRNQSLVRVPGGVR